MTVCLSPSTSLSVAVPTLSPAVISLQRTSATSARVDWGHIPHQDRNGDLVAYHLSYSKAVNRTCTVSVEDQLTTIASASDSMGYLSNLDPLYEYCVRVAGATVYGVGVFGRFWKIPCKSFTEYLIQVHTMRQHCISDSALVYTNSLFQVRLSGVMNCSQWIVSNIKFIIKFT